MTLTRRISLRPLLLATALVSLAACVDNSADAPLLILRNIVPGEGCVIDPAATAFRTSGQIETLAGNGYVFTPLLRNDLTVVSGEPIGPKTIFLTGAHIELSFVDEDLFPAGDVATLDARGLTRFDRLLSGAIDPGGGTVAIGFELVPAELLALVDGILPAASATDPAPATVIDARIQVYGTRGGDEVNSNWFNYPIDVCRGCLTSYVGPCDTLANDFMPSGGGVCNTFQDSGVDCCSIGTELVCPAMAVAPPPV